MKAVIFAGGAGTRLWPLSRKNSPKQFERIVSDQSTLQLAALRLLPDFTGLICMCQPVSNMFRWYRIS